MQILQDGDQVLKLVRNHTDMYLLTLSHQEVFLWNTLFLVKTLKKVEALIEANFKDGLPPHLQPSAKKLTYMPGSDQSCIFVTSHSEFSSLHDQDVQRILRERLILVHGNPFDIIIMVGTLKFLVVCMMLIS